MARDDLWSIGKEFFFVEWPVSEEDSADDDDDDDKNRGRKEQIVWISRNQIRKERAPQNRGNMWIRIDLTERNNGIMKSDIYTHT